MHGEHPTLTIGELARRTGLSTRTVRFWSDEGLVPPAGRSASGYRLYDEAAAVRLQFVRTLRELGLDLPTVRRVLAREVTVGEVAAAHAEAIEAQVRTLRAQQTVLRAIAQSGAGLEEMELMNNLAKLSADERDRIINDFLDEVLGDLPVDEGLAANMRSAMPNLPADPTTEQVAAWVELAELVSDPDFRHLIRGMAERGAAAGDSAGAGSAKGGAAVMEHAGAAREEGIDPTSAAATPAFEAILAAFASDGVDVAAPEWRAQLLDDLERFTDARAERYWQLLAIINGWPAHPPTTPAFEWFASALRARL